MSKNLAIADFAVRREILARLEARTIREGPRERCCWIWNGYTRNGYGSISLENRPVYLHHLSWRLFKGHIPKGKGVLHSCDVRRCWNPAHLFLGTQADNVSDMRAKGRGSDPPTHWGEDHPLVTLTDKEVAEIRERGFINQRATAAEFGVSQSTVWRIAHGVTRRPQCQN